jgi:nucleotide-binding universal stress UspA family protein
MKNIVPALTRLLLPVENFDLFKNALPLVELLSGAMGSRLTKVDLLHVVGGSFLTSHLTNIDLRAGHVLSSELMQRLRDQHFQEFVTPLLARVQELLEKSGGVLQAKVRVVDGDPVKKISAICEGEEYSTLIMSRGSAAGEGFFTGSVVNGVLHRQLSASVYVVGEGGFAEGSSPAARVMIGVDGSPSSLRAVREASLLMKFAGSGVEEVSLVNVLDPSCLYDESGVDCRQASELGYRYMQEAEDILVQSGLDKDKIDSTILFGKPGETLVAHARSFAATMCFIGRSDRSKLAEVLLGSVCGDIIQRCRDKTIVLVV